MGGSKRPLRSPSKTRRSPKAGGGRSAGSGGKSTGTGRGGRAKPKVGGRIARSAGKAAANASRRAGKTGHKKVTKAATGSGTVPKPAAAAGSRKATREPARQEAATARAAASSPPPLPKAKPVPASSREAYEELEQALYLLRDALEAADTFEAFTRELAARGIPEQRVRRLCDLAIEGDLHLHTTASDGKIPARKLPWLARTMGLMTIGVTDHDSVDGCREAFREGMLIGVRVVPGLELSTEQSGLEVLAYFPDAGKLFGYLYSNQGSRLRNVLSRRQQDIHEKSLALLDHVNQWLRRRQVPAEKLITLAEYDRWYGGQKPYFPGTLCVLGLARLAPEQRDKLKIHDPRAFNTKVATPFLRDYGDKQPAGKRKAGPSKGLLKEDVSLLRSMARSGVPVATFVAHPRELLTKGRMSLGAVRKLIRTLAEEHGVDGVEVACARDSEDDVRYWTEIVGEYNASLDARGRRKPLLAASHSSDFHVLGPGRGSGEITLGFGVLDSRPQFRRGNLRPQMPLARFMDLLRQRSRENAGL